jgi:hypothetical protein
MIYTLPSRQDSIERLTVESCLVVLSCDKFYTRDLWGLLLGRFVPRATGEYIPGSYRRHTGMKKTLLFANYLKVGIALVSEG